MKTLVHSFLLPPISLIALMIVGILVQRRNKKIGGFLLAFGAIGSVASFMPAVGKVITQPLLLPAKIWVREDPIQPEVIVVPTGGMFEDNNRRLWLNPDSILRLSRGLQLHSDTGIPLIISGGSTLAGQESEATIAARFFALEESAEIQLEQRSTNSFEAAQYIAGLLRPTNAKSVLLVTSDLHMMRMAASLRHQGLHVVGLQPENIEITWQDAIPYNQGISHLQGALKEYAAIAWYLVSAKISFSDLAP
tara:strand:+ start:1872 stop:2621 length:750 start_codon:yes stop_codon:yes gene_type:complete